MGLLYLLFYTGRVTLRDLTLPCQASEARIASARKIGLRIVTKSLSASKHFASRSLSFSQRCFREHYVSGFTALDVFKDRNAPIFKCQGAQTLRSFEMSGTINPAAHSHNPRRPNPPHCISATKPNLIKRSKSLFILTFKYSYIQWTNC